MDNLSKFLLIIAIFSTAFLTLMILNYLSLKKSIPKLIHMKGLCAHTHELRKLVSSIPQGHLKEDEIWNIIKTFIVSAHGRATFGATSNPSLEIIRDELFEATNDDCNEDVIRRHINHVFEQVDKVDVLLLRKVGVHDIVYPS